MSFDKLFDKRRRDVQTSKHSDNQTSKNPEAENLDVQTSENSNAETSTHLNTQESKTKKKEPPMNSNVETSKHPDSETSNAKSKNKGYTRTTFYLPKTTHQRLKIAAISQGEDMSDIVAELIEKWLEHSDV